MPSQVKLAEFDLLQPIAQELITARHGEKRVIIERACRQLNCTQQTLYRRLKSIGFATERKQRSDAGQTALTYAEAMTISALINETMRANGKRMLSIEDCVHILRANGKIDASRLNHETGEVAPLSASAIIRALQVYRLDRKTLAQPAPHTIMRSLHPNHVWQMDFSVCVLFYLKAERGLAVMREAEFYKGKPANFDRVVNERVQRVVVVDHASGWIYVRYTQGGEKTITAIDVLIEAISQKPDQPVHGVPFVLYHDQGSAFKAGLWKQVTKRLLIDDLAHAPESPQSTGAVEKAQDIVERSFESTLGIGERITSFEELNEAAVQWMAWFNGTRKHSRHGMTRFACWQQIKSNELRIAPAIDQLRTLVTSPPDVRTIRGGDLTVRVSNRLYRLGDVTGLESLRVGDKIEVSRNPYQPDAILVVMPQSDGSERHFTVMPVIEDSYGFPIDGPIIGETFSPVGDTQTERDKKEMRRVAYDEKLQEAADAAAKDKERLPFADVDSRAHMQKPDVAYLPRRGEDLAISAPQVVAPPAQILSHVEAAKQLRARDPELWSSDCFERIVNAYPDGVPEDQLDAAYNRALRRGITLVAVNKT